MAGPNLKTRGRTFLAGKVIFNFNESTVDCVVRRITDDGATIELASGLGIPERFQLAVAGETQPLACKLVWHSERQIGVTFETPQSGDAAAARETSSAERGGDHALRTQMLALRAALRSCAAGYRAARCEAECPLHKPRLPADVGASRRGRRSPSILRRSDVSRA